MAIVFVVFVADNGQYTDIKILKRAVFVITVNCYLTLVSSARKSSHTAGPSRL